MKIGLFFGSFNPIHTGHLIIAQHLADFYMDEVWFVISPQNPFKNTNLLKVEERLLLVQTAIKGNNKFKCCDIELSLPVPSYTINTLEQLKKLFFSHEFFLMIGSDNFLNISSWKSSNTILSDYKIIVYERPEFDIVSQKLDSNITFTKAPLINISSTEIRKLIKINKSIQYLVPDAVNSLIIENNFYS